ncbi:MAG TPA: hypothetical protein PK402_02320 [Tepidisphaeraceae bacterium]|nr:hypothetical protein [Tepidisphaeraceae bacterium]
MPASTELPSLFSETRHFTTRYRWPLVFLVLAAGLDLFTTLWNIRTYGAHIEVHPVQRLVVETIGVEAGVPIAKFVQFCFVVLVASWWRPWCRWIILICAGLYLLAACNNYWMWL